MELIITEKNNAARRIAEILSGDTAHTGEEAGVNVYEWGGKRCIGLSGHVVELDFPSEYENWRDVEPVELIDAPVDKRPSQERIVSAVKRLARRADTVTIATDYDREGELIGKEAVEIVQDVDPDLPIRRVRYSSITENEVRSAFDDPDTLDEDLADAGEARQEIDLVWGAALTRFLSLVSGRLGRDFISVGRVQTPTLRLLVEREKEIRAFEPEDYWELFGDLLADDTAFEAQYVYEAEDGTEADRVWDEERADAVEADLLDAEAATVTDVNRRTRTDSPPAPFNTTQFIKAAGSLGFSAQRAMSLAEDLYTAGYLTYPRTDNTVYPDDLDPEERLEELSAIPDVGDDAETLLADGGDLSPTEGENETTDHPPIHPTGELPERNQLSEDEWTIYELVVRRFYATLADAARWEHLRVVSEASGHRLKANGKRLLDPGYHAVYPYFSTDENLVPDVTEGQRLAIEDVRLEAKQTQPPRRYGQSRLIETMEQMGIGTKATRHDTIEKLYDRGYVEDDPPRPTQLAIAVVEAADEFAERVVSEDMTAELEADMDAIAAGEKRLEDVTEESREMLERVFEELRESREAIGDHIREGLKSDKALGPCPECGEDLLVRSASDGSHFVGCDGYPDCEFTLPLPNTGRPILIEDRCDDHDLRHVKMLAGRQTFVHGCPQCAADDADEHDDVVLGACPECGDGSGGSGDGGELAIKRTRTGSRLCGCTRYPDCDFSVPLPRRGEIEVTDEQCAEHDLPALVVDPDSDDPWELGCPLCNFAEYQARNGEGGIEGLDGVGEKTADKLADAGVDSLDALADAEPDTLADQVDGVSADRVRQWQAQV
jgi:DNA topoisomerase-1